MIKALLFALALTPTASAQTKAVMEGVASTRYAIKVDTIAGRVEIGTTSYSGGIANVGLYVTSNVVVGTSANRNACVIYATGTINCLGVNLSSSALQSSMLASTQTWTGSNTFSGPVKISTGFSAFFSPSATFTANQTSFNAAASVTGSTGSFVVQGTTVACWVAGRVLPSAGDIVQVGIGVDGSVSKIPGTSSTIGVGSSYSAGANVRTGVATYVEFQVSSRTAHSFWLGLWSGGATLTFPDANSIGQFGCREVPSQ